MLKFIWIIAATLIGAAIGNHFNCPGAGAVVGLFVGIVTCFPETLGDVAEGVVDIID